jgi:regulation of enolase protein 1 (concanavalin A-like superfamily)
LIANPPPKKINNFPNPIIMENKQNPLVVNLRSQEPFPDGFPKHFTLGASPQTDIYAAPNHGYVWSSPIIHYPLANCEQFHKASVTISFEWQFRFDQAGLVLVYPSPTCPNPDSSATDRHSHPRWVKAGVELNEGKPQFSVVGRDVWADWSLSTLPLGAEDGSRVEATLEFEKHENALIVYVREGKNAKRQVREIQWVFGEHATRLNYPACPKTNFSSYYKMSHSITFRCGLECTSRGPIRLKKRKTTSRFNSPIFMFHKKYEC